MPLTPEQIEIMKQQPGPPGGTYGGPPAVDEDPGYSNPDMELIPPAQTKPDHRAREDSQMDYDKMDAWLDANVYSRGLVADVGAMCVYDPKTGQKVAEIPYFYKSA